MDSYFGDKPRELFLIRDAGTDGIDDEESSDGASKSETEGVKRKRDALSALDESFLRPAKIMPESTCSTFDNAAIFALIEEQRLMRTFLEKQAEESKKREERALSVNSAILEYLRSKAE